MTLRVNRIQRCCLHDGPGIRTTVFLQGCPLRCWWCHNPETWPDQSASARDIPIPELLVELERDAAYWKESGGGITLSGGEPLHQAGPVLDLCRRARSGDFHVVVDTSGHGTMHDVQSLNPVVSLWLWDLKTVREDASLAATGQGCGPSLENLAWVLDRTTTPLRIRIPLIGSVNASGELSAMADWLRARSRQVAIDVLPGHEHGLSKTAGETPKHRIVPTIDERTEAVETFRRGGIDVTCVDLRRKR